MMHVDPKLLVTNWRLLLDCCMQPRECTTRKLMSAARTAITNRVLEQFIVSSCRQMKSERRWMSESGKRGTEKKWVSDECDSTQLTYLCGVNSTHIYSSKDWVELLHHWRGTCNLFLLELGIVGKQEPEELYTEVEVFVLLYMLHLGGYHCKNNHIVSSVLLSTFGTCWIVEIDRIILLLCHFLCIR